MESQRLAPHQATRRDADAVAEAIIARRRRGHLLAPPSVLWPLVFADVESLSLAEDSKAAVAGLCYELLFHQRLTPSFVSPFFTVFAPLLQQLEDAGVKPILVGLWAATAHGYVSACSSLDLVVRPEHEEPLREFFAARGAPDPQRPFPFAVGREPWCATFDTHFAGVAAGDLPVDIHDLRSGSLEVLGLEALLTLGASVLDEHVVDALKDVKAGTSALDDGERAAVAWDVAGRLTASAAYPDPETRRPHRFVDFRIVRAA